MTRTKYFNSQVFEQDSEIPENEAKARGIYVRASMDDKSGAKSGMTPEVR